MEIYLVKTLGFMMNVNCIPKKEMSFCSKYFDIDLNRIDEIINILNYIKNNA